LEGALAATVVLPIWTTTATGSSSVAREKLAGANRLHRTTALPIIWLVGQLAVFLVTQRAARQETPDCSAGIVRKSATGTATAKSALAAASTTSGRYLRSVSETRQRARLRAVGRNSGVERMGLCGSEYSVLNETY
jgi:hypothetical protein